MFELALTQLFEVIILHCEKLWEPMAFGRKKNQEPSYKKTTTKKIKE